MPGDALNRLTGQMSAVGEATLASFTSTLVPGTPEPFSYDADGNLLSDGWWNYTWDEENRLVKLEARPDVPPVGRCRLELAYDAQGRRVRKKVSAWTGTAYTAQSTNRFLYDGWNLVAELNPQNVAVRTFIWGSDLSGSAQGAGGVGGLLWETASTTAFVGYDGNGNVTLLAGTGTGEAVAEYDYGPFGEVIRATGPMAKANPFQFSTKRKDRTTELLLYEYRPSRDGRWLTYAYDSASQRSCQRSVKPSQGGSNENRPL